MKTAKPIAAISYNTKEYLHLKLDELKTGKIVSEWYYIYHKNEDDEAGKKDHMHVLIIPSKLLQTDDVNEHFKEHDPTNPIPLGCLPFAPSRFDTWYLYGIHDKEYLKSLNKTKKYHYTFDDVITSNPDELYRAVKEIDLGSIDPIGLLQKTMDKGLTLGYLLATRQLPINKTWIWRSAWQELEQEKIANNRRANRAPKARVASDTKEE